jgi:hypothetical protein
LATAGNSAPHPQLLAPATTIAKTAAERTTRIEPISHLLHGHS